MSTAEALTVDTDLMIDRVADPAVFLEDNIYPQPDINPVTLIHGQVVVGRNTVLYTVEVPAELSHEGIAVLVPGFGGIKATSRGLRRELAQCGITTASYEPARNQPAIPSAAQAVHIATLEAISSDLPKNQRLRSTPSVKDIDLNRKILVPHSMGGAAANPYALEHSDEVEEIEYIATVGLGPPTVAQLLKDIPAELIPSLIHEVAPYLFSKEIDLDAKNLMRILNYFLRHPLRTAIETQSCLSTDLTAGAAELTDRGVVQNYLGFEHDILVPPSDDIFEHVDRYEVMLRAGHLAFQLKPYLVAKAIVSFLRREEMDFTKSPEVAPTHLSLSRLLSAIRQR